MKKGTLYWVTGLSGAGKTTIGNRLYYQMRQKEDNIVLLDGDILKQIAGKDLGYDREARIERGYRYSSLCKVLTDQGIHVIICTIAMYDEIRDWNRRNIENYVEVFLDVDLETLRKRNRKGLYSANTNVAGINVEVEFPKAPDIVIVNDGTGSLEEDVRKILEYQVIPKKKWNDDESYWNAYYENQFAQNRAVGVDVEPPSLFAGAMLEQYMEKGNSLVELGCGNGRDSLFFAENGMYVTGIDVSEVAIRELQQKNTNHCIFVCDDFVNAQAIYQIQYDYCYSRFTLHAINEEQETQILGKAYQMLKPNGYLFIEARSVHDGKYGEGQEVEKNAYIHDGHYRRFIDPMELKVKLESMGFTIIELEESDKFAPSNFEKAVCVRAVVQKRYLNQ